MNIRSTKILLSILHVCILGICVLTIYFNKTPENAVTHVPSSSTHVVVSPTEGETETPPATEPGTETVPEVETGAKAETTAEVTTEPETTTEPEAETAPSYSFRSRGTIANVNIRDTPSLNGKIIGRIPIGGEGNVLELTNDEWALIEYNDVIGYSSREWLEIQEIEQ